METLVYYIQAAPVASFIFAVTLVTSLYTMFVKTDALDWFLLNPYKIVHEKQYYRILAGGLVHGSVMHLVFNMLTFFYFAFPLEMRYLSHWQFGFIYLASMVLADVTTIRKHKDNPAYNALGASGAVSGLLFSAILFIIDDPRYAIYLMFIPIPIPPWLFALLFLGVSYVAGRRGGDNINHEAHIWGAITGLVLTMMLVPESAERLAAFIQYKFS